MYLGGVKTSMYGLSAHHVPPRAIPAKNGATQIIQVGSPSQTVEIRRTKVENQKEINGALMKIIEKNFLKILRFQVFLN